jgi:hypothetical protein
MLLLPFVLGTWAGGWRAASLLLLMAWLASYCLAHFVDLTLKSRRRTRYRGPLLLHGTVLLVSGVGCLVLAPWLLVGGLALLPFALVNAAFARARHERHWFNGVVSATAASLFLLVAYGFASGATSWSQLGDLDWHVPVELFDLCWLYLVGTVLFVKTMIRESGSTSYLRWSVGFHVAALAVVARLEPWLLVPFAWYFARSLLLPRTGLRPAQVGAVEIVNMVLLVGFAVTFVIG